VPCLHRLAHQLMGRRGLAPGESSDSVPTGMICRIPEGRVEKSVGIRWLTFDCKDDPYHL